MQDNASEMLQLLWILKCDPNPLEDFTNGCNECSLSISPVLSSEEEEESIFFEPETAIEPKKDDLMLQTII